MLRNITIRTVEHRDIPAVLKLMHQHALFEKAVLPMYVTEQVLIEKLLIEVKVHCLVVEIDSEIEGYMTYMKQFSTWEMSSYIYMDTLFVNKEYRRKGVGRLLMNSLKNSALNEEIHSVEWQTPPFNDVGIQFYLAIGATNLTKKRFYWCLK